MNNMKDFELNTQVDSTDDLMQTCINVTEAADVTIPVPSNTEINSAPHDAQTNKFHDSFGPSRMLPSDDVSITVPAKTEISADTYNAAIKTLEQSFKEGAAILGMLQNVTLNQRDLDAEQATYTESVIHDAIMESYVSGPYFEAVDNQHKKIIKSAIKSIRRVAETPRTDKFGLSVFGKHVQFHSTVEEIGIMTAVAALVPLLFESASVSVAQQGYRLLFNSFLFDKIGTNNARVNRSMKTRLWQMVGTFLTKNSDNVADAIAHYTELFSEMLETENVALKFSAIEIAPRASNIKNYNGKCWMLIVDTEEVSGERVEIELSDEDVKNIKDELAKKDTKTDAKSDAIAKKDK